MATADARKQGCNAFKILRGEARIIFMQLLPRKVSGGHAVVKWGRIPEKKPGQGNQREAKGAPGDSWDVAGRHICLPADRFPGKSL